MAIDIAFNISKIVGGKETKNRKWESQVRNARKETTSKKKTYGCIKLVQH